MPPECGAESEVASRCRMGACFDVGPSIGTFGEASNNSPRMIATIGLCKNELIDRTFPGLDPCCRGQDRRGQERYGQLVNRYNSTRLLLDRASPTDRVQTELSCQRDHPNRGELASTRSPTNSGPLHPASMCR